MGGQEVGLIGVTGASGGLGTRVAKGLAAHGVRQRLIARNASKVPSLRGSHVSRVTDFGDFDSFKAAVDGVSTLFLVSGREHIDRLKHHMTAVDAAVAAGVDRIVYTSFLGASPDAVFTLGRQHYATEEHIKSKGIGYTFLRDSIYLDFVPWFASGGVIRGPAGSGKIAPVARDDVAQGAVAVLTASGKYDGETFLMTGPKTFSMQEAAEELSRVSGREITYIDETIEEAWESRRASGAPDWEIEGWISSYLSIAKGEMDVVGDAVPNLTGHPAIGLPEYLAAHPESYAKLTAEPATVPPPPPD